MRQNIEFKKLTHTDPNTFEKTQVSFNPIHCEISEKLKDSLVGEDLTITPVIVSSNLRDLVFGVLHNYENGDSSTFKVTIEKVKDTIKEVQEYQTSE